MKVGNVQFRSNLLIKETKQEIFTTIRQDINTKDEIIDSINKKVTEVEYYIKEKENIIDDLVLRIRNVEKK